MTWLGKLIGFLIGAVLLGPIGALIGLFLGHIVDTNRNGRNPHFQSIQTEAQQAFFDTTFATMGHIAKADGHISEDEIAIARTIMQRIGLNEQQKQKAIHEFTRGKQADFNIEANLNFLMRMCHHHRSLLKLFVDIQIQAAYATGSASPKQQHILQTICRMLNMPALNFTLLNLLYGRTHHHSNDQQHSDYSYQRQSFNPTPNAPSLQECYALLDTSATATDADVKKAYRRMMSQNHPDKLVAKGLPEKMVKLATEKTQRIQKAYEQICKARGM